MNEEAGTLYFLATDSDGRSFLYCRRPVRDYVLGVWKMKFNEGLEDDGSEWTIDNAVVPYEGKDAPRWDDEPRKIYLSRAEHTLLYYDYVGDEAKAKDLRYKIMRRKKRQDAKQEHR